MLDDRLTELTDRARNRPGSEQISVLAQALAQAGRPVTVLRWLSYGHSADLMNRLLDHDGPLTHQHLDALPPSKAVHYVRDDRRPLQQTCLEPPGHVLKLDKHCHHTVK